MTLYPIHLHLEGKVCVVIGGGNVAERKVTGLRAAAARVRLVSPTVTPALQKLAELGEAEWFEETYQAGHLDGAFLVMACTNSREVNADVTRDAQARNLFVLCADDPDAGNFISPTVIRRGELLLTVSTGGGSPTLAAVLREQLESDFGPEWAALTALIGEMREIVKTNPDEAGRKDAIRRVIEDKTVRGLLAQGKRLEAETRIRKCLSSSLE